MKYQVIARKFRPQVFEDVVGQKPIVQTLQNAIQLNRIGHAYLFSGPRGVGKTTMARILAKGLNCVEGPTIHPCNRCPSCVEIAASQSIDVLEIDAASNTGVDHIRELRENARYAPSRDRFKIFIIDEVHMLSKSAFNALLKILEEPPAHVIFIMATTERGALPATILSRCQQFIFRTISAGEIQTHLREIASSEDVKIDDRALTYIVRASEGSMRDAQSLLDQIISFGGQQIADEDVRDVLGFIPNEILDQTLEAIAEHNSKALIEIVGRLIDQGLNIQQFVREFIGRVRDLLLMRLGLEDKILGSPEEKESMKRWAAEFSEQDLLRYFDILLKLDTDLRGTSEPRFHVEVGFIKLARIGHIRDIEDVIREFRHGGPSGKPQPPRETTGPVPKVSKPDNPPAKPFIAGPAPPAQQGSGSFRDEFLHKVELRSPITAVYAGKAERIERHGDTVEIVMANAAQFAAIDSAEHRAVLDEIATRLAGKPVSVSVSTQGQPPPVRREPAAKAASPAASSESMDSARDEPMVKKFLEVFRGDLAHVKPVKGD